MINIGNKPSQKGFRWKWGSTDSKLNSLLLLSLLATQPENRQGRVSLNVDSPNLDKSTDESVKLSVSSTKKRTRDVRWKRLDYNGGLGRDHCPSTPRRTHAQFAKQASESVSACNRDSVVSLSSMLERERDHTTHKCVDGFLLVSGVAEGRGGAHRKLMSGWEQNTAQMGRKDSFPLCIAWSQKVGWQRNPRGFGRRRFGASLQKSVSENCSSDS
jgi:hypothetical protein